MSPTTRHIIKLIILVDIILAVCILAEQKLTGLDSAVYSAAARLSTADKNTRLRLLGPQASADTEKIVLHEVRRYYPPVFLLNWEPDGRDDLSAYPLPRIQELATIIHCLTTKAGVSCLGISSPLMWEDSRDDMSRQMLMRALQGCRLTCLGLPARNAAQAEVTPDQLQAAAIPHYLVEGDPAELPYANAPLPYVSPLPDRHALLWAPDYIEDAPAGKDAAQGLSCPLLLRWKGDILPTLPLRLALAQQGLTPADVQVRLGKSIRIGKRLLPLDTRGRTPLGSARVVPLPLADILSAPPADPDGQPSAAILSRPFTPDQNGQHAVRLAATLSLLLSSESEIYIPTERPVGGMQLELNPLQGTLTGRIVMAAFVICALIWLPLLPRKGQLIALAALALVGLAAAIIWFCQGVWMSLCAGALGWLLLSAAVLVLSRSIKQPCPPSAPAE